MFGAVEYGPVFKLRAQQIRYIIRASMGLQRLCQADMCLKVMLDYVFVEENRSSCCIDEGAYIQLLFCKVENRRGASSLPHILP